MIGVFRVQGLYGVQGYVGSDLQAFLADPAPSWKTLAYARVLHCIGI